MSQTTLIPVTSVTGQVARAAAQGKAFAVAAASLWAAVGVDTVLRSNPESYRDAIVLVAFTLTAAAFQRLHVVQRASGGKLERFSFYALTASMGLALVGQFGVVFGVESLQSLGFPLGALLWLITLVPYGIATVRASVLPRHVGIAISLLEIGSIAFGLAMSPISPLHDSGTYSAGIEKAFVLLLIARALGQLGSSRAGADR